MYKLVIDTSTSILYLGLVKDNNVIDERYVVGKNDHSKNIVSTIEDILNKENIKVTELDSVICGVGPGSYTGVRMSVTVSKMICAFSDVKLYKVSSLYMMASNYQGNIISIIDARRGNGFCAIISNDEIIEEALMNKEEVINKYNDYQVIHESMYKVDAIKVINKALRVDNPHSLVPNYLRETEAERNLHD